jgi:ketosteroid isomerase-like protein
MTSTTTTEELIKLSYDWMQAWKDNDMDFLEDILAPDFRLLTSELWVMPREKWLASVPVYTCHSFEYKQQEVRDYGNAAIVQSNYSQTATLNGEDRSGDFLITDIWVKQNGNWRVAHRHTSYKK